MTKLTDNLYAVEVPKDATDFEFNESDSSVLMFCTKKDIRHILVPKKSIFIGTVTKDSIDFDCEPYVDGNNGGQADTMWRDYSYPINSFAPFHCPNPEDSFRSLLTSKGLTDYSKLVIIKKV